MTRLAFTVTGLTPAFLGDAEEHGRWRTLIGDLAMTTNGERFLP
jgi:hypothetical protein